MGIRTSYVENYGEKNAAAELRKSMSNSVANSMRACWQLTKQYRQNGLWRYSVTVKWGGADTEL